MAEEVYEASMNFSYAGALRVVSTITEVGMSIILIILVLFLLLTCHNAITAGQALAQPELVLAEDPDTKCCDEICSVAFSPDGTVMAAKLYHSDLAGHKGIALWNVITGSLIKVIDGPPDGVYWLRFGPDGHTIGSSDGQIWDLEGERRLGLVRAGDMIDAIAFSPDGKLVASSEGRLTRSSTLWDAHTGAALHTFKSDAPSGRELQFSRDGGTLVSAGRDFLQLWSVETRQVVRTISPDCGDFSRFAYSEHQNILAVTECGNTGNMAIQLYDARTGRFIKELVGHKSVVWCLDFSSDGQFLASAGGDLTIRLWDTSQGVLLRTLSGHSKINRAVAFSPDGRTMASGGGRNDTKIWSVTDGELIATLRVFKDGNWVVHTPDNFYLRSEGGSKYIKWKVDGRSYRESVYKRRFFRPDIVAQRLQRK